MALEIPRKMKITIFPGTDEEETVEVQIIDVTTTVTFPELLKPEEVLAITYVRGLYPPSVVFIPKRGATLETVEEAIRKDIEGEIRREEKFIIP